MGILNSKYDFVAEGRRFILLFGTNKKQLFVDGELICDVSDKYGWPSSEIPLMICQLQDGKRKKTIEVYLEGIIRDKFTVKIDGSTVFVKT